MKLLIMQFFSIFPLLHQNAFLHLNSGTVSLTPIQGMDVYMYVCFLVFVFSSVGDRIIPHPRSLANWFLGVIAFELLLRLEVIRGPNLPTKEEEEKGEE
jgi:hypothetical protein